MIIHRYDIIDLDIEFIGDAQAASWDGTGKCSTHHGESDCYADVYNLCGVNVVGGNRSWIFTQVCEH